MVAPSFLQQTWALVRKNLIINLRRHFFTTSIRSFILPVIFIAILSYSRNLFVPPALYGIGSPAPVKSLADSLAENSNKKLVFVSNGLGGEVDEVIASLVDQLEGAGTVVVIDEETKLRTECAQSLRGASECFAAVVFEGSPNTGNENGWNYTLRADGSFAQRVNVEKHTNDVQKYLLPLQAAVDRSIAEQDGYSGPDIKVEEYIYTSMSKDEYEDKLRTRFSAAMINYLSVAYLIGMIGIVYHLTGFQAMEREKGLSTLIEAMGGSKFARMASYHYSFSAIYFAGWIVMSLNTWSGIFARSSAVIVLIWFITSGWALASWSLFLGAIFKKAQLSGISVTVFSLGLGVIAQVSKNSGTGAFAVLSLLFPPMNFVFHSITMARWEGQELGANVVKGATDGNSSLPIIAFWIFSIVQAIVFPILAAYVERFLFGTASVGHRHVNSGTLAPGTAVELRGFTKRYPPRLLTKLFGKAHNKEPVVAVDHLDLDVLEGQIMVLLGANGSGKTTTLEAIAGLASVKEGNISINTGTGGGVGICPQKNVLWDEMTVEEHVRIWNLIKCKGDDKETLKKLIEDCDLTKKRHARSKTLSGGQKRKLQLAAMFTGGSNICAIDEVSSGIDPLSRRKIWDIILAARGSRTIMMTSHFLDEADLLADHIAMLSKGKLKCEGSAVQLKTQYGGGYRVHAPRDAPEFDGVPMKRFYDQTVYNITNATESSRLIEALEEAGVSDYYVQGPTIEDVFLKVAEESIATRSENAGEKLMVAETVDRVSATTSQTNSNTDEKKSVNLQNGTNISVFKQTWIIIRKRLTILQRGYLPTVAAIAIPIIAAAITIITFKDFKGVSCAEADRYSSDPIENFFFIPRLQMVAGPRDEFTTSRLESLAGSVAPSGVEVDQSAFSNAIEIVDDLDSFNQYIRDNYADVNPGGIFLGSDSATFAFKGNGFSVLGPLFLQNTINNLFFDVDGGIKTGYREFDQQWSKNQGDTLIFTVYAGLALAAFPAFFALYPTVERIRQVRALHYSNGVRALPLWLAHTLFDFVSVLVVSVVCTIIFNAATSGWYGLGYLFLILVLYGLASTMLVYNISLVVRSQLAAFAFAAGGQAVMFLIYFIVQMSIITYAEPLETDRMMDISHYVMGAIAPICCLIHALFVALNSFSIDCNGTTLESNPGTFRLYGGIIMILILQIIVLFSVLVLYDSGKFRMGFGFGKKTQVQRDEEDNAFEEKEIADELRRVDSSNDGLRVLRLSKNFDKFQAVDNVTFGVPRGEVFALLGPNGAGKTTTINMVRGELPPTSGDIFVQNIAVNKNRAAARTHLGVCPQFDAMDRMTVTEHLVFYARIRGVKDVDYNVEEIIRAVGLDEFRFRTAEQLSGGNKRKLSLGIALMGNPAVLLLDEPSSGMDAAAKRVMWRTLESVVPGRSLVLTTHSMEECSALANRAGILAKRMLALGTTEQLRRKYGDKYLVHVVLASAPYSNAEEMDTVKGWISRSFPGAELEPRSFGGQVRFSIPAHVQGEDQTERSSVGQVFKKLELEGPTHGLKFWSVDRGTMDMVFLEVVGRNQVQEEGYEETKKPMWKKVLMMVFVPWMYFIR